MVSHTFAFEMIFASHVGNQHFEEYEMYDVLDSSFSLSCKLMSREIGPEIQKFCQYT